MPNVFNFQLVSSVWVGRGVRIGKSKQTNKKPKLHVSGFVRVRGSSVVVLAYLLGRNLAPEEPDGTCACQSGCPWQVGGQISLEFWFVPATPCSHGLCLPSFLLLSGFHHHHPLSPLPYKMPPSSPTDSQCQSRALAGDDVRVKHSSSPDICRLKAEP